MFESFVNSERCKTAASDINEGLGLRALLIQKDAKQMLVSAGLEDGLRALLIQKDAKHFDAYGKPSIQFESFVNSERCKTRISSLCYE